MQERGLRDAINPYLQSQAAALATTHTVPAGADGQLQAKFLRGMLRPVRIIEGNFRGTQDRVDHRKKAGRSSLHLKYSKKSA